MFYYKFLPILLTLIAILFSCQPQLTTEQIKEHYMTEAVQQFPEIKQFSTKIILGQLNEDAITDAVIQYHFGEGMKPVGTSFIVVLSDGKNLEFQKFEPNYCPQLDTIINGKIHLNEKKDCIDSFAPITKKHEVYLSKNELKDKVIWEEKDDLITELMRLKKDLQSLDSAQL